MIDVKPGQIWKIDGHRARIMNVLGDEVEAWYRDTPTAPGDLATTVRLSAKTMTDATRFELLREPLETKPDPS